MSFIFNIKINFICVKERKDTLLIDAILQQLDNSDIELSDSDVDDDVQDPTYALTDTEAPVATPTIQEIIKEESDSDILTAHNQSAALPITQFQKQKTNKVEFKWKASTR